jgi:hypothetical protein
MDRVMSHTKKVFKFHPYTGTAVVLLILALTLASLSCYLFYLSYTDGGIEAVLPFSLGVAALAFGLLCFMGVSMSRRTCVRKLDFWVRRKNFVFILLIFLFCVAIIYFGFSIAQSKLNVTFVRTIGGALQYEIIDLGNIPRGMIIYVNWDADAPVSIYLTNYTSVYHGIQEALWTGSYISASGKALGFKWITDHQDHYVLVIAKPVTYADVTVTVDVGTVRIPWEVPGFSTLMGLLFILAYGLRRFRQTVGFSLKKLLQAALSLIKLREFKIFIITFLAYVLCAPTFFQSSNEVTRFELARALMEKQTVILTTDYNYALKMGLWPDVSFYDYAFYSALAPGASFLVIPFILVGDLLQALFPSVAFFNPVTFAIMLPSLSTSLTAILIYKTCVMLGAKDRSSALTSLVYAFGTIAWAFSESFFPHAISAFLVTSGIYLVLKYTHHDSASIELLAISGFILGCAVLVEYPLVLVLPPLLCYLYVRKRDFVTLGYFLVPYVVSLASVWLYNAICFDSPFVFPEQYGVLLAQKGVPWTEVFSNPIQVGLYGLLFDQFRGLFYYSPVLLFALPGFYLLYKDHWETAVLFASTFLIFLFFYSKWWCWFGGSSFGPRFLLPALPLLTIPLHKVIDQYFHEKAFWSAFLIACAISVVVSALGALTCPASSEDVASPVLDYNLMKIEWGEVISWVYLSNTKWFDILYAVNPILPKLVPAFFMITYGVAGMWWLNLFPPLNRRRTKTESGRKVS